MEFKKQNWSILGKGRGNKIKIERKTNHERLLTLGNKLRVAGGERGGTIRELGNGH